MKKLNDLAWENLDHNLDSAKHYAQIAIRADIPKTTYQLTVAYNAMGTYFQRSGAYDSATYYFTNSLSLRRGLGDTIPIVNSYLNLGSLFYDIGYYNQSIDTLKQALQLLSHKAVKGDSLPVKASILNIIGMGYMETGRYSEALEALSKAYELRLEHGNRLALARSALNFGHLFELIHDYTKAKELYRGALEGFLDEDVNAGVAKCYKSLADVYLYEGQYELSEQNYADARKLFQELGDQQEVAATYSNLGYLNEIQGNYEKALAQQEIALSLYTSIDDKDGIVASLNHLGQIKLKQGDYEEVINHLQKALVDSLAAAPLLRNIYQALTEAYGQVNNYEQAFEYALLGESISEKQDLALQELIRERYKRELAESERELLSEKLAKEKARSRSQDLQIYIMYVVGFALALLFFISWKNFRQRLRLRKAREKERDRIDQINQIMQDQKVHKMDALIEGQQAERLRIAQDIHDRLGSLLSVLKIHFVEVTGQLKSIQLKTENKVGEVNTLIDEATRTLREISQDLRTGVLDEMGLVPAIEELCQRVRDTGAIEVESHTESVKEKLDPSLEWTIYRNVEEALNNTLKHANASKVIVQIFQGKDHVSVTVEDNGVGFEAGAIKESESRKSLGLKGMRARTRKYNGSFDIDSKKERGTIIMMDFRLEIPDNYGDKNEPF